MSTMHEKPILIASTAVAGLVLLVGSRLGSEASGSPGADRGSPASFNAEGELERPKDYRTWVFMGAPLTPNDMNGGAAAFPEFHNVYVDPESYREYKRTGEFRDGAVIVKELVSVGSKASSSGKGYFQGDFLGVEAMVKDVARFPDTPSNWGFFRFTDEEAAARGELGEVASVAKDVAESCVGCHAGGQHDRVFTQHYPVLRAARGAKRNPEND